MPRKSILCPCILSTLQPKKFGTQSNSPIRPRKSAQLCKVRDHARELKRGSMAVTKYYTALTRFQQELDLFKPSAASVLKNIESLSKKPVPMIFLRDSTRNLMKFVEELLRHDRKLKKCLQKPKEKKAGGGTCSTN